MFFFKYKKEKELTRTDINPLKRKKCAISWEGAGIPDCGNFQATKRFKKFY